METSKQGFVEAPAPSSLVSARREDEMPGVQAPLQMVYLHTLYAQPPVGQDTQALPLLTLQVAGGMQLHHAGQVPPAAAPPAKSKTEGKHVCSYCGRDCRKPSVLQKHLRCHTGERPFPCTTCGVAFKTQSNLYKHKRTQAHARLSSDSEQESLSSQDSAQGSRASSWCESSASFGEGAATPNTTTASPSSPQALPRGTSKTGPDNEAASHQAGLLGLIVGPVEGNQEDQSFSESGSQLPEKDEKGKRAPQTQTRHLLLQRQEATFSKRWGSCTSSGKSQSHDSTDSGFSESTDLNWTTSPGSVLHDRSMESLKESSTEEHEDALTPATPRDACPNGSGTRSQVSEQEKKKLEERISKLISENNAVVDDKRLENVRPRKTMPSKQGSIDLPMPYTYKDSFHFEMKTGSNWQTAERKVKQALYNSVPTQGSASLEEGPLTRSSSLPFTACNLGLERSSHYPCCHREGTHQNMRCNTVQGDLLMRSVDQPSTHHRSLVRQKAVDWLPATESLLVTSSLEEDSSGTNDSELVDNAAESGIGKCRRRRSQKFSYNKWHMYGGSGTFTKLYNFEKSSDRDLSKIKKPLQREEKGRGPDIQKRDMALFKEHGKPVMSSQDALKADATEANVQPTFDQPPLLSSVSNNATAELANFTPSNTFLHKRALQKSHSESDSAAKLSTEVPVQGVNELPSDRKKQRTSYCALPVQVDTSVGSSLGLVTGPAMLRDNERLHHPAEFYGEESPDDQLDFTVSSTNHNQDQKSRSSLSFKEQHAPARSSFLPKYQLKLPQTDSMSNSSTLQVGDKGATDDFTVSIAKPTVTFHSAEGHTAPRQGSSAEIHPSIYSPVTTHMSPSAQRQSMPPTPRLDDSIALKSGSDSVLPPTATLTFSVPPASVLPEMGNDFPEYKGEIMLLNETSHSSADNGRFGKNNTKILQIFVQFIPEEQLPFVEPPLNSQEPAQDVSQEEDETINLSHQGLKTPPRIDQHGDCTHSGSLSVSVTDCTNTAGQIEGVPQEVQMQDGAVSPDCRGGLLEEHSLRTCGEMVDAPVETSSVETSSVETSSVETTSGEAERTWLQIETAEGSPRVAPCINTAGLKPLTKDKLVPQHHQEESCPKMQNQFEETGTRESHGGHHQVVSAAIQETPNPVAAPQQITDDSKRTPTHTHHPKHLFRCKLRHPAAQLHNTKFLKYRNRIKKPGQIHQSTKSEGWTDACDTPAPNLHYQHCSSATCPASSDPPEYQSGVQPSPMKQQMYAVNATSNEPSDHLQAIPSLFPKESHCSLVSVTTSCATGLTSQAGPAAVDTLSGTPTNMEVALLQLLSQQTLGANLSPSPCSAADVRSQTTSHDSGGRQLLNEGGGCSMDELVTRSVCRVTTRDEKPRDLLPSGLVVSTQGCKTTHGLVRQKALAPSLLHSGEMHQPTAPTSEGSSDEAQSKVAGFATVPPPSSAQCDPVVSSSCSSPGQAMDVSHRPDPPVSLPDLYHGAAGEKSTVDGKPLPTSPCQQDSKSNDMSAGSSVQEAQGCGPGGTAGPRVKVNAHAGETTQNPVTTSPGTGDERAEPASGRSQRGSALLLPGVGASATPNSDVWKPAECGLPACPVNVSVPALCGPTGPEDESVTAGKRREEEEEEEEEEAESSSSDDEGKLVIEL